MPALSEFQHQLRIIESHLDTFGHVNNSSYLKIFEEIRWDIITRNGYGLERVKELKKGPVMLEIHIRFHRELLNREEITIKTEILEYHGKIGKMRQSIFKNTTELATEAQYTFGLMDTVARKLIEPTPEWRSALGI